jgi:hypothetical protein
MEASMISDDGLRIDPVTPPLSEVSPADEAPMNDEDSGSETDDQRRRLNEAFDFKEVVRDEKERQDEDDDEA